MQVQIVYIMTTFLVSQAHLFRVQKNAFIDAHSMHVNLLRNTNNEIVDGCPVTQGNGSMHIC